MRRAALLLMLAVALAAAPGRGGAGAQELVADSSRHLVAITTGFVGTEVLLFGATEGRGDVIIVVRGPARNEVTRRKGRHGGIWINEAEVTFTNVPSYYWLASSKPIDNLLRPEALERHGIGVNHLALVTPKKVGEKELAGFRAGLLRNKIKDGLFTTKPRDIAFLGDRLFRTAIYFPANVPTGPYTVQVFLVREGRVAGAQTVPLNIAKVGIGADVYHFAHASSALYGIFAIVIALAAGLLAGVIFRKA
ncbi:MAG: TIGR02186 family protein [Alphaproteobacteria bacterium]|nr:TIGR02186 family protein [Alphaproteobacteria bacterium]